MEGSIDMGRKGRESIGYYTHFVTFNCDLNHAIDLQQATNHYLSQRWPSSLTHIYRDAALGDMR